MFAKELKQRCTGPPTPRPEENHTENFDPETGEDK